MQVSAIKAFHDNYIWAIYDDQHLIVVDPGDPAPVQSFIEQHQLTLTAILVTHHHHDHTGGIAPLLKQHPEVDVYGPALEQIAHCKYHLQEGDKLTFATPKCSFEVLEIPGHTLGHIAYFGKAGLFCGDTLFYAGCGRLFEGSPEQMMHSLNRLAELPESTLLYCAHEYTEANLKFALAVEPDNKQIVLTQKSVQQLRANQKPTLPTTIGLQKKLNPFLRLDSNTLKSKVETWSGFACPSKLQRFTQLRRWKDEF